MAVSFSESDASFWVSVCSQASLVPRPDTGRDELSWVRGSVTSSQNTHAHSPWAVAAEVSRKRARSRLALRGGCMIHLPLFVLRGGVLRGATCGGSSPGVVEWALRI